MFKIKKREVKLIVYKHETRIGSLRSKAIRLHAIWFCVKQQKIWRDFLFVFMNPFRKSSLECHHNNKWVNCPTNKTVHWKVNLFYCLPHSKDEHYILHSNLHPVEYSRFIPHEFLCKPMVAQYKCGVSRPHSRPYSWSGRSRFTLKVMFRTLFRPLQYPWYRHS